MDTPPEKPAANAAATELVETNKAPAKGSSLAEALKIFGLITAVPTVLFTLINAFFEKPGVMILVAVASALIATGYLYKTGKANLLWVVVSWLTLVVAMVTVTIIWPRTMMVNGRIFERAGVPLANETVHLIDAYGVPHEVVTDADGRYVFQNIQSGPYRVKVRGMEIGGGAGGLLVRVLTTDFLSSAASGPTVIAGEQATNQPPPTYTPNPTYTPPAVQPPHPTYTIYPTYTPMYALPDQGWVTYKDDKGGAVRILPVAARNPSAVQLDYTIGQDGWVGIAKEVALGSLSGSYGIRFSYQGSGSPNTIEFKLIDQQETTFSVLWNATTDTKGAWKTEMVDFSRFKCWAKPNGACPADQSLQIKPEEIKRIDFAVSNKRGDIPGSGSVIIDEVRVIP